MRIFRLSMMWVFLLTVILLPACSTREKQPEKQQVAAPVERGIIKIDSQSANVQIEKTESSEPEIVNQTDASQVSFEKNVTGKTIEIKSTGLQSMVVNPGQIIVRVPANYDISAESMSGSFNVTGFGGNVLKISTMSGNLQSGAAGIASTTLESMSGNITVAAKINDGMHEFKSMSGSVVLMLSKDSSATIMATSEQSSVTINGKNAMSSSLKEVVGQGKATVNAVSDAGSVQCTF